MRDRTLAINLLIHAPPDEARAALVDRSDLEWQETNETMEDAGTESYRISPDSGVDWDDAAGSTRYTYIDATPHGGEAEWIDESYQLHDGTYLGSRAHIRAYANEDDNWTAIQAHEEYFDWFRLRHTVTDSNDAAVASKTTSSTSRLSNRSVERTTGSTAGGATVGSPKSS